MERKEKPGGWLIFAAPAYGAPFAAVTADGSEVEDACRSLDEASDLEEVTMRDRGVEAPD